MAASLAGEPPESTRLRIGDDIAWSEISGVYDRDNSLKENTNPKSLLATKNHPGGAHTSAGAGSASQRFSGNLKPTAAPIIGLSGGKLGLGAGSARRHHPPAMLLFPGKAPSGRAPRAGAVLPEPASPKVSCIGRVLSERERARLRSRGGGGPPPGCCGLGALLRRRSRSRRCAVDRADDHPPPLPEPARRPRMKAVEVEAEATAPEPAPAPGLGGMRRFASGRRSAEWAAGMEDDGHVARSGPL
ncbi:hypothetical protein U9M48_034916 [Paspalum notatum var. saurae]|uniref:Uncharacterized protein n=1 Tax=Paspalum notatum var. saurae TaxID=547442 RepID=A0AAQ3UE96_PASNO